MLIEIATDMFPCLGSLELAALWDPCHFVNLVVLALVGPGDQTSPFFAGESVGASSDLLFTYLCKIA